MSDKQIDPKNIEDLGRISEPDLAEYNPLQEKIGYLETRIKVLEGICQEINPYEPISDELKLRLRNFNIIALDDPFKVTNALLTLLEDTIDELHILKPFDPESSEVKEIL